MEILTVADDNFAEFHDLKVANVVEMDDPLLYKEEFQLFFQLQFHEIFGLWPHPHKVSLTPVWPTQQGQNRR